MLYIIRGVPGSGKSTIAKTMVASGDIDCFFEVDMFFELGGSYSFDRSKISQAHAWCQDQVRAAIARGQRVAVSNTFVKRWEAKAYFDMAAEAGIEVVVITAKGRYDNVHGVPPEVVERMLANWEHF